MKDLVWKWVVSAPPAVVLSICLTVTGGLGGWVWVIAGEQADQKAAVAVAVEKSRGAVEKALEVQDAQTRVESKIDRLLEAVARIEANEAAKRRREKTQ